MPLIPDLDPPDAPKIGKFGTMRHDYLRNHHRGIFDGMLLSGTLNAHLEDIVRHANEMMERLTAQMARAEGITETLKVKDGGFDFAETKVIGNRAYKWFFNGDFTVAGKEPEEPIEVIDTDFEDISNEPADNSFVDPNNK